MSEPTRQFDIGSLGGTQPPVTDRPGLRPVAWNAGADLGLLILRLAVGGIFLVHGLQKVLGLWGGLGLAETTEILTQHGFRSASVLAYVLGVGEIALGGLLVLGLFTPFAAAGLLAVKVTAIIVKWGMPFFAAVAPNALEIDVLLGAGAATLLFTGAGRLALDRGRTWQRRPLPWAILALIVGAGAAVLVLLVLR